MHSDILRYVRFIKLNYGSNALQHCQLVNQYKEYLADNPDNPDLNLITSVHNYNRYT